MKERIINFIKLLFCFTLFTYISTIVTIILEIVGIDTVNISELSRTLINFGVAVFLSIVVTIVYRKELIKDFQEFKINWKCKVLFGLKLFGIFMLLKFLASYLSSILSLIFNIEQITSENQITINELLGQFPLLMSMSAVILAPYYEEILFRLGFKKCIKNKRLFILISGCLFGLIHIFPTDLHLGVALIQSIPYVMMGLTLAYFYDKYNNICYSMLVHFYNNLLSVVVILLSFLINIF